MWDQWWPYNDGMVTSDRDELGIYELADENKNTVYYGSGKLKTRLQEHLSKKECPMARFYRIDYYSSETEPRTQEQRLLEEYKRVHGKLPMYNERIGQANKSLWRKIALQNPNDRKTSAPAHAVSPLRTSKKEAKIRT